MTGDIETLEVVAAWKEDLQTRLDRARLLYELVSTENREEIVALGAEVESYTRLIATLRRLGAISHA